MLKALSQAEIDAIAAQGRKLLQADREPPKYLNLQNALALGQPIPLEWRGQMFTIKALSNREGLGLQRAERQMASWGQAPQTVEDVEEREAELIEMLVLFHSLLLPMPESNPFADASPLEVGELLGFFSACLMMQNVPPQHWGSPFPTSTRSIN